MRHFSIIVALCLITGASSAHAVVFNDNNYNNWSFSTMIVGTGSSTATQEMSGGNPGEHLRITDSPAGSGPYGSQAWSLCINNNNAVWNPAVDGAIDHINFSIDTKPMQLNYHTGWSLLLVQDGKYYIARYKDREYVNYTDQWESFVRTSLSQDDFGEFVVPGPPLGASPDFSASGKPITLGFAAGNSYGPYTCIELFDNWQAEIVVPEPASLSLLVLGGLALIRRKRQ